MTDPENSIVIFIDGIPLDDWEKSLISDFVRTIRHKFGPDIRVTVRHTTSKDWEPK